MTPATRQEVMQALDRTKDAIAGNMLSKSDIQTIVQMVRGGILHDLHNLHAENQRNMKQAENARAIILQRMATIDANLARIEQKIQGLTNEQAKTSFTVGKMQSDSSGYLFQRI